MITLGKPLMIKGNDANEVAEIANGLQTLINNTEPADIKKLVTKAAKKPGLIQKALKWI